MVSRPFPVALARGKHLFPFRTEQLSPSAPMVLGSQGPGRVGRRRFLRRRQGRLRAARRRLRSRRRRHDPRTPPNGAASRPGAGLPHHGGSGRGSAGSPAPAARDGACEGARAAALDAGGPPGSARPCRPPSRRRGRPRAAETSESGGGHRAHAGRGLMFALTGTCVRNVRQAVGRIPANTCTYRLRAAESAW